MDAHDDPHRPAAGTCLPRTDDAPYVRIGLAALAITFVLLLAWATLAPLRSAVVADGRLVAASDNRTVEHLDGGLIEEVRVRDGDPVSAGQVLLRLDPMPLEIRRDNVEARLLEIEANLARLAAERRDLDTLDFPASLVERADTDFEREILATQRALLDTRRQALAAERDMLVQRARQAVNQAASLEQVVATLRNRVALLDQDLDGLRKLSSGKLAASSKLRETQRQRNELVGEIAAREGEMASPAEMAAKIRQRIELRRCPPAPSVAPVTRSVRGRVPVPSTLLLIGLGSIRVAGRRPGDGQQGAHALTGPRGSAAAHAIRCRRDPNAACSSETRDRPALSHG